MQHVAECHIGVLKINFVCLL